MKASLAASKRLIDMEARGEIDKVARNAKNEGKMLYDEEGYVTTNLTENRHQQQAPMDHAKAAPRKNTKVPQAVLESMMSNPIDTSPLNGGMEEVDRQANEMMEHLTTQMAKAEGVTEALKAQDQMEWVRRKNNSVR